MATMTITAEMMRKMAMIVIMTMMMIVVMETNVVTMAVKLDKRRLWSCVVKTRSVSVVALTCVSSNFRLGTVSHYSKINVCHLDAPL